MCQFPATGLHIKFDLQLLSQCGCTPIRLSRSAPEIQIALYRKVKQPTHNPPRTENDEIPAYQIVPVPTLSHGLLCARSITGWATKQNTQPASAEKHFPGKLNRLFTLRIKGKFQTQLAGVLSRRSSAVSCGVIRPSFTSPTIPVDFRLASLQRSL